MASELEPYRPSVVLPLSPSEVDTIKDVLAPGVSDAELALFVKVADHLGLSPFRDEVVLIGRYSNEARRKVYKHQVTVHGRRVLAQRTGELRGVDGPYFTGPWEGPPDQRPWVDVWDRPEPPRAAAVYVYREGWAKPVRRTAVWPEMAQYVPKYEGDRRVGEKLAPQWERMPSHMLGKVAESAALRVAFPEVITAAVAGEWDDIDAAEPPAHPAAGGEEAPGREVGTMPSPGRAHLAADVPKMTPDQADTIAVYLGQLGLAGEAERPARMRYLSDVLSRDVGDARTITWEEAERVIAALVEAVAALYATDEPEVPDEPERCAECGCERGSPGGEGVCECECHKGEP